MGESIKVALLGVGTVGSGVFRVLTSERELELKVGTPLELACVIDKDADRAKSLGVPDSLFYDDLDKALNVCQPDILIEVIGGIDPARSLITTALNRGINVVTANKELIANHGEELLDLARAKGVDLYFEASVGGGIPIIHALRESLVANNIDTVMGIVNGTTNYILSKMTSEGTGFAAALADAQSHGYAEADPRADVDGLDAAYKTAILAALAFNARVRAQDIYVEGITAITPQDIMYADELDCVIKLLAIAKEDEGGIEARVHPTLITKDHPLANVNDVYNAVFINGDAVGSVMFYGRGAGSMPTASAIVGDVIDIARNKLSRSNAQPGLFFHDKLIKPMAEIESSYYLLIKAKDRSGVLAKIADAFGRHEVSLASVIQKTAKVPVADLVFTTHRVKEKSLMAAIEDIRVLDVVSEIASMIRIEGD